MSLFQEECRVLSEIAGRGVQLELPRSVDFSHVFPDSPSAQNLSLSGNRGFEAVVEGVGRDKNPWDVNVSTAMDPQLRKHQLRLKKSDRLARRLGSFADGLSFTCRGA